jgi:hypothetical protein
MSDREITEENTQKKLCKPRVAKFFACFLSREKRRNEG